MARHSLEPSLWASKWMCFPTCLSSISACLRENAKATTQFGKHALSLNALLLCMLFRPLRLIANVSVCVPAHLSNALLPFCFATPIAECMGAEQVQTIPDECHCLLILNPCDLLSCAASLFRPISLNVIVLPCFPILVCWCQIARCLRNMPDSKTPTRSKWGKDFVFHLFITSYTDRGICFLIQKSNAQTTFNHCRCMSTYFCIPHIYVCMWIYTYISTYTHTCTHTQACQTF